jgi:hypothetical protein
MAGLPACLRRRGGADPQQALQFVHPQDVRETLVTPEPEVSSFLPRPLRDVDEDADAGGVHEYVGNVDDQPARLGFEEIQQQLARFAGAAEVERACHRHNRDPTVPLDFGIEGAGGGASRKSSIHLGPFLDC